MSELEMRPLGPDGPPLSVVGIGAMSFAGVYGDATEEESHRLLDAALDAGVNHLDTSNVYGMGRSEEICGRWLERYRDKGGQPFRVATKAGISRDPDTGARTFDNSAAHLTRELDGSLKRLGLEQVDLYYVHRRDPRLEIEEVTETLAGFVRAGKVARIGYSEIAPTSLRRAMAVHPVAAVQSEYSLQTRAPDLGLVDACEELGVTLVAFSPVGRGLLTDRPPTTDRVEASVFLKENPRFTRGNLERNVAASEGLRDLAADLGRSTAALAIAWVLARSRSIVTIPGTRNPDHLAELIDGATRPLSADETAEVDRRMPVGWCHGARYSPAQANGPEDYG